jgi:DNA-binding transcriptional regulator YdaS (Cro superfamily)
VTGIDALTAWMKAIRGRASELADALGITHAAIPQWREVPADKLRAVERVTGIKRQILRPDLFEGMSA